MAYTINQEKKKKKKKKTLWEAVFGCLCALLLLLKIVCLSREVKSTGLDLVFKTWKENFLHGIGQKLLFEHRTLKI